MFPSTKNEAEEAPTTKPIENPYDPTTAKYKNIINLYSSNGDEINYNMMDQILEREKKHNKTESWLKLDKTVKIQKLHQFAEKYGKENALPVKEVKTLKAFFVECLEKNKLNKTRDVTYSKDSQDIQSIPALHFNALNRSFTLKNTDTKRVSTLKSLTPKRTTPKDTVQDDLDQP
jgi:Holliday junction resolvase